MAQPLPKQQLMIVVGAIVLVVVLGYLIVSNLRPSKNSLPPITLTVWGTDRSATLEGIMNSYKTLRPNVTVQYVQVAAKGYREKILSALAAGTGPDIFFLGNHDVPSMKSILSPADLTQFPPINVDNLFPEVVAQDLVLQGKTYALPLFLDTMAMLYNKDMFDRASIAIPPATWDQVLAVLPKLTTIGTNGQIITAGAALGGSDRTIDRATDIINLLMIQNGTQMTSTDGSTATFAEGAHNEGLNAFNFYLQFGNTTSPYYTWNESQPSSLESFAAGKTGIIFDYHSRLAAIKARSPFLRVGIAPFPALLNGAPVTYADYQALAVSKQSKASAWAWDFVVFATTNESVVQSYLTETGNPPALRTAVAKHGTDPEYGIFAKGALVARGWSIPDYRAVSNIFTDTITSVSSGALDATRALRQAQDQVNQLSHAQ